jgi:hypothetical protein
MNISDYSTKVKNLVDVFAFIRALVDDEDLMAMTLNGLGKNYSQFRTSITIRKTFPDFQHLITLLISEELRIVSSSSNGGSQENAFYSNSKEVKVKVVKLHFEVDTKTRMVDIINMKVSLMEVEKKTLEEEEVVEAMVEVIEVNNQITTQTATSAKNLGTWQRIIIKRNMMHEIESYNKKIMH